MELARRAREAYRARFDEQTAEDSLAYTAAEEIQHQHRTLEEDVARDPFGNADKRVNATDVISGWGGGEIPEDELAMYGIEGEYLEEDTRYHKFDDGSILAQHEDGTLKLQMFQRDLEVAPVEESSPPREAYEVEDTLNLTNTHTNTPTLER